MFKDTITYEDFDGNIREETVYFNMSRMEAMELMASYPDGYDHYLQSVVDSGDSRLIVDTFSGFVKKAYGVKSEDGTRFVKSEELSEEFGQTAVYDEIMMKLAQNEEYVKAFVRGVVPQGIQNSAANAS